MIDLTFAGCIIVALLMVLLAIRVQRRLHQRSPSRLRDQLCPVEPIENTPIGYLVEYENGCAALYSKHPDIDRRCVGFGPESFMEAERRLPKPGRANVRIGPPTALCRSSNRQPPPGVQYPEYGRKKDVEEGP